MEQNRPHSEAKPLKILLSGSSGLLGGALAPHLAAAGHEVWRLVRRAPRAESREIRWDPDGGAVDPGTLEGFSAVIHLSGENIAARRWTPEFKAKLVRSRIVTASLLAGTLAKLSAKPAVFICASAVGYYGDRGAEILTERSARGEGFLPELADRWEIAARQAQSSGIRSVQARFGVVLSRHGGALEKMLLPFKLGVGGVLGSGNQYMSWIAIEDAVRALEHLLGSASLSGPVNLVSPHPVTNREFTKTLASALHRPAFIPVPEFGIKLLFGEMGEALLLASTRVVPEALAQSGFHFSSPELAPALRRQLGGE